MKITNHIFALAAVAVMLFWCSFASLANSINVIPQPSSVQVFDGECNIAGATFRIDKKFSKETIAAVNGFAESLKLASGKKNGRGKAVLVFELSNDIVKEGYAIEVSNNKVYVKASDFNGVLYAIETIKQMLPVEIYTKKPCDGGDWTLPYMRIEDHPRFAYRGLHLDVARHFFDIDQVKKYLDIMAIHKLNTFHWHLTDDQGWRIEIKKYPLLTEVGSIRKETLKGHFRRSKEFDGTPYGEGMWYTQDQIKEVVAYAASKGITVIPEIDLPGHMVAALAAYPELGCTGGPYEVWRTWGITKDVLCVGKESTIEFLKNVLSEVCELFPSEYIHIGGDECPKDKWKECPHCQAKIKELCLVGNEKYSAEYYLQSYITRQMEEFLATKGKKIIGWDEILEGEISKNVTVMSWRGNEHGLEAIKRGHDVIMVNKGSLYFDYCQIKDSSKEPLTIGGHVSVEKVYSYEPYTDEMTDAEKARILGIQANMWTEYITSNDYLEYMILPRLSALSEIQWCSPTGKDYGRFLEKMGAMVRIYEALGYNYAKHIFIK